MGELLDICNLDQFVNSPTHSKGHILDLVIARSSDNLINSVHVDCLMTDHVSILCSLNLKKPPLLKQRISYRKLKEINHERFASDIVKSFEHFNSSTCTDLSEIVHLYILHSAKSLMIMHLLSLALSLFDLPISGIHLRLM